ncbi:hypothetical protein EX30DRAFT_356723 [Ascodesmis nigricans]|uniref:ARB-07466-like C-terminal domain-containing protein n=1 Tax=Ascodesmis nigricans TaxID=341454 RepID=A0A4S2MNY4_9PEZI|nr:hypothetical protein EX30DRAFT_356723 [Ascodesmis nigricans]
MRFDLVLLIATALPAVQAALNGYCVNGRTPGTCITTSDCTAAGGTYQSGNCPNDAADVKCCQKPVCGTSSSSSCRWTNGGTSSCSGSTLAGYCPGPSAFKCCVAPGTWAKPTIPSYNCQSHVIAAGNRALTAFSGHVQSVGCYGTRSGTSDHPAGLALDFMVGTYNPRGWAIAEWHMNNAAVNKVKYVMWGQRIWSPSDGVKAWENWRNQSPYDRGDVTSNHW